MPTLIAGQPDTSALEAKCVDERDVTVRTVEPLSTEVRRSAATWEECTIWMVRGFGTVVSVVGAGVLLGRMRASADWRLVLGCSVYATTLLAVHICSMLAHIAEKRRTKRAFRNLDQAFLYLLMVGTSAPIAVLYLSGGGLSVVYWVAWCATLTGFLIKTVRQHHVDSKSAVAYVVLSWMPILAAHSAWLEVPRPALSLLVVGGLLNLIGAAFFLNNGRWKRLHAAWQLLVTAGSAFHFYALILCFAAMGAARGG